MQRATKWLSIFGLTLTLIGAACGTYGVWLSPDEAMERGVSRWSGGTRDEQLKLPPVQNLLEQSHFALAGFILIGVGTFLQIVDPYLDSFARSFAAANYTAGTIRTYRHLARKLGRLMGTGGIAPSALTPDLADQLARTAARGPGSRIRFHNLARQFAEHLIDIGVAQPVPLTEAQIARTAEPRCARTSGPQAGLRSRARSRQNLS
jgi:hypothetical protein